MTEFTQQEIDEIRQQAENNPISFEELLSRHKVVGVGEHHLDPTLRRQLLAEMERLHLLGLLDEIVIEIEDSSLEMVRNAGPLTPDELGNALLLRNDYLDLVAAAKCLGIPVSGSDSTRMERSVYFTQERLAPRVGSSATNERMMASSNSSMAGHIAAASADGRHVVYFTGLLHQIRRARTPHIQPVGEQLRDQGVDAVDAIQIGGRTTREPVDEAAYTDRLPLATAAGVDDKSFVSRAGDTRFLHLPTEDITRQQLGLMYGDMLTVQALGHPSRIVGVFADLVSSRTDAGWSCMGTALTTWGLEESAVIAHRFGVAAGDSTQLLDLSRLMSFDGKNEEAAKYAREAVLRGVPGAVLVAEHLHKAIGDPTTADLLRRCRQNDTDAIDNLRRIQDSDPVVDPSPAPITAQLGEVADAVKRELSAHSEALLSEVQHRSSFTGTATVPNRDVSLRLPEIDMYHVFSAGSHHEDMHADVGETSFGRHVREEGEPIHPLFLDLPPVPVFDPPSPSPAHESPTSRRDIPGLDHKSAEASESDQNDAFVGMPMIVGESHGQLSNATGSPPSPARVRRIVRRRVGRLTNIGDTTEVRRPAPSLLTPTSPSDEGREVEIGADELRTNAHPSQHDDHSNDTTTDTGLHM